MQHALITLMNDLDPQAIEREAGEDRGIARAGDLAQGEAVGRLCGALAGQDRDAKAAG